MTFDSAYLWGICMRSQLLPLLLAVAFCGCPPGDFPGDDTKIRFSSNLSRPHDAFDLAGNAVQVGTPLRVTATTTLPWDGGAATPPDASVSVDDTTFFSAPDAGTDVFSGVVSKPGVATLTWTGSTVDKFSVRGAVAVTAEIQDPVTFRGGGVSRYPINHGVAWAGPGSSFWLVEGQPIFFDVLLRGTDAGWVAHGSGRVDVSVNDAGFTATTSAFGTLVTALDGGTTTFATVTMSQSGSPLGTFRVNRGFVQDVVAVDLAVNDRSVPGYALIKATGKLDGGQALWQAPVTWTYDPRLEPYDYLARLKQTLPRNDLLLLVWKGDAGLIPTDSGYVDLNITAQIGSASASIAYSMPPPTVPQAPDAGEPDAGQPDAGEPDAGDIDSGTNQVDAGSTPDAGAPPDAGTPQDSGSLADSGARRDSGTQADGGTGDTTSPGCGCGSSSGAAFGLWALGVAGLLSRPRRRRAA